MLYARHPSTRRIRNISVIVQPITDFGYKNLLVSGCSFTMSEGQHLSWPYFLQQLGSFENLIDCACNGAGNYHIHHSTIWEIENNPGITPDNTLVVIMWSGYDRDDIIVDPLSINQSHGCQYQYNDQAWLAITGGDGASANTVIPLDLLSKIKNLTSRSIDNYVLISSLYHYLTAKKFRFVFTEFRTPDSEHDSNFEPTPYLGTVAQSFTNLVRQISPNLGDYSNVVSSPTRHPTRQQHYEWCRDILVPHLTQVLD